MKAWRKFAIVLVIGFGLTAAVASGSDSSSDGSKKSSSEEGSKGASAGNNSSGKTDELDDVTVSACAREELFGPKATLEITNNSTDPSDYMITVSFESPDGATNFGTGNAFVQRLAPGQKKTEEVSSLETNVPEGEITCKITKVDRSASL